MLNRNGEHRTPTPKPKLYSRSILEKSDPDVTKKAGSALWDVPINRQKQTE